MLDHENIAWDKLYKEHGSIALSCRVANIRRWYDTYGHIITTFTIDNPIIVDGVMYGEFLLSQFHIYQNNSKFMPDLMIDDFITIRIEQDSHSIEVHERTVASMSLCPMCHSTLSMRYHKGEYIGRCLSKSCPGTMTNNLSHFTDVMGILQSPHLQSILHAIMTRGSVLNPVQLFYIRDIDISHPDIPQEHVFEFLNEVHAIRGRQYDDKCSIVLRALNIFGMSDNFYIAIDSYFKAHSYGLIHLFELKDPKYMAGIEGYYPAGSPAVAYKRDKFYWKEYLSNPANKDTYDHLIHILIT